MKHNIKYRTESMVVTFVSTVVTPGVLHPPLLITFFAILGDSRTSDKMMRMSESAMTAGASYVWGIWQGYEKKY